MQSQLEEASVAPLNKPKGRLESDLLSEEVGKRKDFVLIAQACLDLADPSPQVETPQVRRREAGAAGTALVGAVLSASSSLCFPLHTERTQELHKMQMEAVAFKHRNVRASAQELSSSRRARAVACSQSWEAVALAINFVSEYLVCTARFGPFGVRTTFRQLVQGQVALVVDGSGWD